MKWLIWAAAVAIAGCANPAQEAVDAEDEYKIVAKSGSSEEKCAAARKVEAAWLKQKSQANYETWNLNRRLDCLKAAQGS